jgi:MFS family permease
LIPHERLGDFFARRLFWGTAAASAGTLAAGFMVDRLPLADRLHTYGVAFALAGLAGFVSSYYLARTPEPRMPPPALHAALTAQLRAPLHDPNFRRLLIFLAAWNVASNLAAPFLTVFLIKQLGYPLTLVTILGVVSQLANALTLYAWGRLSDRLSNKAILAAALPVHFLCMFALVFGDAFRNLNLQYAMLVGIHALLGVAGGGIGLATGNLGLKLAPKGQGTPYLAAIGIVSAVFGGITPVLAGSLAHTFEQAELSAVLRWVYSAESREFTVVNFTHWEFLFAGSALIGLYVMHALSRVQEGEDISESAVMQEFAFEAVRSAVNLSSAAGFMGSLFPFFDRVLGRLAFWEPAPSAAQVRPPKPP